MVLSRFGVACVVAATAISLMTSASFGGGVTTTCANPTFRIPPGSPFNVFPKPGVKGLPQALVAGNFVKRSGSEPRCDCDLAVALGTGTSPAEGFVALMRGNEDGTFASSPGSSVAVGQNPVAIASGPFKIGGAGLDGFVVVSREADGSGRAEIFAPRDDGSYHPPPSGPAVWRTGLKPVAITTGDFNGDGALDAATANQEDKTLTVLLGTGTGTFRSEPITVTGLGGSPESLASGKFSGDAGPDDIAVAILQNVGGSERVAIRIVRGNASGGFSADPEILGVGEPNSLRPWIAAANLSAPPTGSAPGQWRDLVVAFTDRTATGTPIGRVKVLLGKDGGGFLGEHRHDIGAPPQSIKVSDIDDDLVVDLMVSTYSESASTLDGTIRFFQGRKAPAADAGFHANPDWFTIPETTAIRPKSLVTGRFGPKRQGGRPPNVALAAVNAHALDTVSVFLGNGQGAFVQPSVFSHKIGKDDRLFTLGDFHSATGDSKLLDLAYVTRLPGRNVLSFLMSNGAGGFGAPSDPQSFSAGVNPQLVAAGAFDQEKPLDIAVVDVNPQDPENKPIVKVFLGEGDGRFKLSDGVSEFFLTAGDRPVAIATGRFRGSSMPLDIAIVSETSASSGRLTILLNNGSGEFPELKMQSLNFRPGAMVASNNLTEGKRFDLIVRDADTNRFLFLVNIGDAGFRPATNESAGFFGGAGNVNSILIGNIDSNNPTNKFDDIVTFDGNMTVRVFLNSGSESFEPRQIDPVEDDTDFELARPPYALADFGEGRLGLAAGVSISGKLGLALLKGDGNGGFSLVTTAVEPKPTNGELLSSKGETLFKQTPLELGVTSDLRVGNALAGQFRSTIHGNNKPDVAIISELVTKTFTEGACVDDPRPTPETPPPRPAEEICRTPSPIEDCTNSPCFEGPCCNCTTGHPHRRCPGFCDVFPPPEPGPQPPPFQPFCETTRVFAPTITVFSNTCGD